MGGGVRGMRRYVHEEWVMVCVCDSNTDTQTGHTIH